MPVLQNTNPPKQTSETLSKKVSIDHTSDHLKQPPDRVQQEKKYRSYK